MVDGPKWITEITPAMRTTEALPEATLAYDLFSDALRWSDEIPPCLSDNANVVNCLRGLWRYRTSLIIGQPDARYAELWDAAVRAFPNWPGFSPGRRDSTLRTIYETKARESLRGWEVLEHTEGDRHHLTSMTGRDSVRQQ